jgi:hypothetical protein
VIRHEGKMCRAASAAGIVGEGEVTHARFVSTIAYHVRACELLGLRGPREAHRVATLLQWARTHQLTLPDALLEWVEVGGAEAMPIGEHARFAFFDKRVAQVGPSPALVVQTGLWQDFVHVVPLNGSDDPQVVYLSEVGGKTRAPIEIAPSLSAFIVAQAFDRRAAGEAFSKLLVSGSHHCDDLKALFTEYPSTRSLERGDDRKLSRFMRSKNERMTVSVSEDVVTIDIVGEPARVRSLEAELRARFADDVIEVDLRSCLATVGYPEAWLDTGWLPRAELVHQAERRRAECSTPGWHTIHPLAGTEHYRTGAFGRALQDARVWSGEKLDDLLTLMALDPDPGMASSFACCLVADDSPLADEAALRAARHPAMALSAGAFWLAVGRLRRAGLPRSETRSHAISLLERMSAWEQQRVMQHGVDDDITTWLAIHGRNQRVRKFARHGLHQRGGALQ